MPLNDLNKNSISFKKVVGKAHTQQGFAFTEEGIVTNIPISFTTVFGEQINPNPIGLTATGDTDGVVEKLRFELEIIPDTQIGTNQSQGYRLVLPSESSIYPQYSGFTYLHEGLGKLQIVPSLYGELQGDGTTLYDPVLYQTNGTTEITKFDPINWILDSYNGVLFVQDPPAGYDISASRPAFIDAFLYVGKYLDDTLSGVTTGGTSNVSGVRLEKEITQLSHGFVLGDVLAYSGSSYFKPTSIIDGGEPLGIVGEVIDTDTFNILFVGYIEGISGVTDVFSNPLSGNSVYYLSTSIAGKLTPVESDTIGDIVKPMLITLDNNSGSVLQYRGNLIATGGTDGGGGVPSSGVTNIRTTDITTSASYPVTEDNALLVASGTTTYTLPLSPSNGLEFTFTDGLGTASTTPITLNGNGKNIADDTFALINTNYGSITIVYNGLFWNVTSFVN